jgi:hypothetical protein
MRRVLLLLVLAGVVLALSSCNVVLGFIKTDQMVLDGDEYELTEMYLEYFGDENGFHEYAIALTSSGVDYDEDSIGGEGDLVWLFFASPDQELADGSYEYSSSSSPDDFDIVGGFVFIGADFDGSDIDGWYEIVDGTMDVKLLFNDEYMIEMNLELDDLIEGGSGPDLELFFQAEISDEYDYSSSSSMSITTPLENRIFNLF